MYLKRKMKPQLLGNVSYISKWQRIMGLGKALQTSPIGTLCMDPAFSNLQHSRFVST